MGVKIIATNKKAHHEYFILEEIEAGIELTGTEIKSIRLGKININDSYAQIKKGEIYLINCHISKYDKEPFFKALKDIAIPKLKTFEKFPFLLKSKYAKLLLSPKA